MYVLTSRVNDMVTRYTTLEKRMCPSSIAKPRSTRNSGKPYMAPAPQARRTGFKRGGAPSYLMCDGTTRITVLDKNDSASDTGARLCLGLGAMVGREQVQKVQFVQVPSGAARSGWTTWSYRATRRMPQCDSRRPCRGQQWHGVRFDQIDHNWQQ